MDKYVEGIVMDFQMDRFLLIDKGGRSTAHGPKLKWQGIGGKIENKFIPDYKDRLSEHGSTIPESPHEAITREFQEETNYEIKEKRWHCYYIKTYKNLKLYHFAVFMSPDELNKICETAFKKPGKEGPIGIHTLVDCYWDPQQYTFDIPYLIQIIIREMKAGMFMQLDPESINSRDKTP